MSTLYQLTDKFTALKDSLIVAAEDGELSPMMEASLDALNVAIDLKLENCCRAVRNLEADAAALRAEAARFAQRAQHAENAVKRLKAYMQLNLEKLGQTRMDAGLFRVRIQANSQPTVTYDGDPEQLPFELRKVAYSVDAKAVVEAWKAEKPLPDGVSVVRNSHLRIY
jgi:hypothetical protein